MEQNPNTILMNKKNSHIFSLRHVIIQLMLIFSKATPENPTAIPPSAGLLCISDCTTCPVICSPPPPPVKSAVAPPPVHLSPPQSYYFPTPPPPPTQSSPPPQSYYFPTPPAPPTVQSSPPPPSFISWGEAPTPPSPPPPPPPPPYNYVTVPSGSQWPPITGQRNSSLPYYYFYASKGSSSTNISLEYFPFFLIFLFFCRAMV